MMRQAALSVIALTHLALVTAPVQDTAALAQTYPLTQPPVLSCNGTSPDASGNCAVTSTGQSAAQVQSAIAAQAAQDAATYATAAQVSAAQSPIGAFTVATLPACTSAIYGKLAYASDLGGGANNVKCVAGSWQHLSLGMPVQNAATGTVAITPLASAPIEVLTGSSYPLGSTLNITGTPYPGEPFYFVMPSTLGGLISSLGVNVNGVSSGISLLPGKTYFLVANASGQLVQVQ